MRYVNLYDKFVSLRESVGKKRLLLFSGPSATGKSTLAKSLGATHWWDRVSAAVIVGTDDFGGDRHFGAFKRLLSKNGMPSLGSALPDWPATFGQSDGKQVFYGSEFDEWRSSAPDDEVSRFLSLCGKYPLKVSQVPSNNLPHRNPDGRITEMAWCAELLPDSCGTVIFDDVSVGIKAYFDDVEEWLLFTPLDWLLKNIESRNLSGDKAERIDVNDKGTALYQYCGWWQASGVPDLDNKSYTAENVRRMLSAAGHADPDEILRMLGVEGDLENEFYITSRPWIDRSTMIVNTRDLCTGRAIEAPSKL